MSDTRTHHHLHTTADCEKSLHQLLIQRSFFINHHAEIAQAQISLDEGHRQVGAWGCWSTPNFWTWVIQWIILYTVNRPVVVSILYFSSDCLKINLMQCKISKFPGGACPQTPLLESWLGTYLVRHKIAPKNVQSCLWPCGCLAYVGVWWHAVRKITWVLLVHCLATFHNTLLLNADIILTQNNKILIKFSVLSCDEDNLNNSVAPPETPLHSRDTYNFLNSSFLLTSRRCWYCCWE